MRLPPPSPVPVLRHWWVSLWAAILRGAFAFLAGLALGDVPCLAVAAAGLAIIAKPFAGELVVIKCLSGLYLLYIAYGFGTRRAGLAKVQSTRARDGFCAFASG